MIWKPTRIHFRKSLKRCRTNLRAIGTSGIAWLTVNNEENRRRALDRMVDLLNRRSYIKNLVRDVNEALGN